MNLTGIICTHNPRRHYLSRVLAALRQQTLPLRQWELLLVDNASTEPLASIVDLSWHPNARLVGEAALGLTFARLRGIAEARGELLVFVDDDNVLDPDYLEQAWNIAQTRPDLGAWGGSARPEFEAEPPAWTKPYWKMLAIRRVDQDVWSHAVVPDSNLPNGAGLCVRRAVGQLYRGQINDSPVRLGLDRKGQSLISGGDMDLALTACSLGLGHGVFARLALTHLIPPERLTEDYLVRLREGLTLSARLLKLHYSSDPALPLRTGKWWLKFVYNYARTWGRKRKFLLAKYRGEKLASRIYLELMLAGKGQAQVPAEQPA